MKIIILSSITINSGTGIRIFNIAENLSKNNYVILTTIGSRKKNVGKLKYIKIPKFMSSLLTHFITLIANFVIVLMNRTDFIIASKSLPTSCLPAIFGKIFGAKIILDMDDLEYSYWKETRFERVLKLFDKNFPKFFNRVTTHTNGLINYVNKELKIPKKRIIFLPQGIVYEMFQNVKSNLKKQLGLKDYKIIVYTAHLGVAAKSNVIFKVIKNITKKKNNIKLIVVGGGRYLNYYKKLAKTMHIENNVIFTGYVDHKKISEYLSIADVAINYLEKNLANKYRSSIKVREYIASGVPVVCNIVSDDLEQLSRFLYYFDTGNLKEFEKQIFSALKGSNKKRISEGKNFVKNWDWKLIVKNFENELLKIK